MHQVCLIIANNQVCKAHMPCDTQQRPTLRKVSSTLALEKPMSTMFCTIAGSGAAVGLETVATLFSTAEAAVVPVVQSVRMLMTCLVMRKLHLGSLL